MEKDIVYNKLDAYNTVGEEILDIVEANGKDISDFLNLMGWNIEEARSKTRVILLDIKKINSYLSIEANLKEYLFTFQKNYKEAEKKILIELREQRKLYRKVRVFESLALLRFNDGIDKLEDIENFLDLEDIKGYDTMMSELVSAPLYKNPASKNIDPIALKGWLRFGEVDLEQSSLGVYDERALMNWVLSKEWKSRLNDIDYILSLPVVFSSFGVCLSLTPFLPKTPYGAARWIDGNPLIQASDRDKSNAAFWITLFHEIGHVIKHVGDDIIDHELRGRKVKEKEANEFVYEYLYGGENVCGKVFHHKKNDGVLDDIYIENCAREFDVPTTLVSYWVRKAGGDPYYTQRFRTKIDFINMLEPSF